MRRHALLAVFVLFVIDRAPAQQPTPVLQWGLEGVVGPDVLFHDRPVKPAVPDAIGVSGAFESNVVLTPDGRVWTWGSNAHGQLGDGTNAARALPAPVPGLDHVVAVSAGSYHVLALKDDRTVWSWGFNQMGQLGNGTFADQYVPAPVPGLTDVTAIAAGGQHSLALTADGRVFAFGSAQYGQAGLGVFTQRFSTATPIAGFSNATAIDALGDMSIAVASGTVWTWGSNRNGQLGDGTKTDRAAPGPIGLVNAVAVAAGGDGAAALLADGTVATWGTAGHGILGDGSWTDRLAPALVPGLSNVRQLDAGFLHMVALKQDGTVWVWGSNADWYQLGLGMSRYFATNVPLQVTTISGVRSVAAGAESVLALGYFTNEVDTDPPVISCAAAPSGWQGADVSVACTAVDARSGLAVAGDASFTLSTSVAAGVETTNAATGVREVCDRAGNCAVAGPVTGIWIDRKGPEVSCGAAPAGWQSGNVSIACTATDVGSGLATAGDAGFSLSTAIADGVETADAATGSRSVCDVVGNCSAAGPVPGIRIDRSGPSVSCAAAPAGWQGGNVTVACTATDGGSGLAVAGDAGFTLSTSVAAGVETTSASTGTHTVCDRVGHCAAAGPVAGIWIDRNGPAVSCAPGPAGWQGGNVSVACTATDGGSGLAAAGDARFDLSTNEAAGIETTTGATGTRQVCDAVGNCANAGPVTGIWIDRRGPAISCAPAPSGWQAGNVTLSCTATEAGSGLAVAGDASFTLSTSVAAGVETTNAATGGREVCDRAGNCAAAGPVTGIWIDRKGPEVSCGAAPAGWQSGNVSIACTATDVGSGLAAAGDAGFALATSVPAGIETTGASTGSRPVCDRAGNCAAAGPVGGIWIDRKGPAITLTAPGGVYTLNQLATASYSCGDGGAGLATCAGPVPSGAVVPTTSAGLQSFTVTAVDAAGNASTATATFSVSYGICVAYDNSKAVKSGATIPIKLTVCDAAGTNLSSADIVLHAISIGQYSSSASFEVQDAGNANPDNDFRFAGGFYIFNLKTTGLATGSYAVQFTAGADPTAHLALFQVR